MMRPCRFISWNKCTPLVGDDSGAGYAGQSTDTKGQAFDL